VFNSLTIGQVARQPPQPLIQIYYQCVLRPYDSFYQALGLSLGNSDVYTAVGFFVCMFMFMMYLWYGRGFTAELNVFVSDLQKKISETKEEGEAAIHAVIHKMEYGNNKQQSGRVVPVEIVE
jgi:hypothetical protein